jgi:phospholipase DDHD1
MITSLIYEANRVYRLFCQRNPYFAKSGRVSIIAHSLGSALATDILSNQPTFVKPLNEMSLMEQRTTKKFVFDVSKVFFVGSPVGFFFHMHR